MEEPAGNVALSESADAFEFFTLAAAEDFTEYDEVIGVVLDFVFGFAVGARNEGAVAEVVETTTDAFWLAVSDVGGGVFGYYVSND